MPPRAKKAAGKRYPLNMRTTLELREKVERAAKASGRSLVQEVEYRLEQSFEVQSITAAVAEAAADAYASAGAATADAAEAYREALNAYREAGIASEHALNFSMMLSRYLLTADTDPSARDLLEHLREIVGEIKEQYAKSVLKTETKAAEFAAKLKKEAEKKGDK